MTRKTYIQDPMTGKLVLKNSYVPKSFHTHAVHGDIESFTSPITGEVISDRGQLRRHNRENGVTDSRDYSRKSNEKRSKEMDLERRGQTPQAKKERIELIKQACEQHRR